MTMWLVCRICVNNLHHWRVIHHYHPHYDHQYQILNIYNVHGLLCVWVTVATAPAGEEMQVWSVDHLCLWFWLPTTTKFRLSNKQRWSVDQFRVSFFVSVLNKWLDFPFWSWPISELGFLYARVFSFLVSAYFQCGCKQSPARSFCETESNRIKVRTVPYFIFLWVLRELFDPSQGCTGRTSSFMLAQQGAGEMSRVYSTPHPLRHIKG